MRGTTALVCMVLQAWAKILILIIQFDKYKLFRIWSTALLCKGPASKVSYMDLNIGRKTKIKLCRFLKKK